LLQGHDLWLQKYWSNIPEGNLEVLEVPNQEERRGLDDVVVKTTEEDKLIADLTEPFANL
jgi:hypothetical protein